MRQTLAVSLLEQPSASDRLRGVNLSVNTKKPAQESREKGKFVYKSSNTTGLRIGKGGPARIQSWNLWFWRGSGRSN